MDGHEESSETTEQSEKTDGYLVAVSQNFSQDGPSHQNTSAAIDLLIQQALQQHQSSQGDTSTVYADEATSIMVSLAGSQQNEVPVIQTDPQFTPHDVQTTNTEGSSLILKSGSAPGSYVLVKETGEEQNYANLLLQSPAIYTQPPEKTVINYSVPNNSQNCIPVLPNLASAPIYMNTTINSSLTPTVLPTANTTLLSSGVCSIPTSGKANRKSENSINVNANLVEANCSKTSINTVSNPVSTNLNDAPLGSSRNPIRIIQQGNQYTSLQHLTQDQLSQIMQVVQQQQTIKSTSPTSTTTDGKTATPGTSSVLYNPQTRTKIIYRVVYPSELHSAPSDSTPTTGSKKESPSKTPQHKRTYKKRKQESTETSMDGSVGESLELSREEKMAKKKHRPRTRSGRVSRPPKFMVQDYKHIHPVDYEEDYDDSDGGYSDFRQSSGEDEDGSSARKRKSTEYIGQLEQLGIIRSRRNKCNTCGKSYIGTGGLARHFRLYPSHGQVDDLSNDAGSASTDLSQAVTGADIDPSTPTVASASDDLEISVQSCGSTATVDPTVQGSDADHLQDDSDLIGDKGAGKQSISRIDTPEPTSFIIPTFSQRGGRGGRRGRPPTKNQAEKRRERLQQFVHQCTDDEVLEHMMPRIASSLSVWEYLIIRAAGGSVAVRPDWVTLLREFDQLHREIRAVVKENFKSVEGIAVNLEDRDEGVQECKDQGDESVDGMECDSRTVTSDCIIDAREGNTIGEATDIVNIKTLTSVDQEEEDGHVGGSSIKTAQISERRGMCDETIKIEDDDMAHCLGLPVGRYLIRNEQNSKSHRSADSATSQCMQNTLDDPTDNPISNVSLCASSSHQADLLVETEKPTNEAVGGEQDQQNENRGTSEEMNVGVNQCDVSFNGEQSSDIIDSSCGVVVSDSIHGSDSNEVCSNGLTVDPLTELSCFESNHMHTMVVPATNFPQCPLNITQKIKLMRRLNLIAIIVMK